ncbi:MAG: cytochrome c peroxidase [Gammaproteobacteria bacterium]|nr:cytochrome c peroxidase [Gammaproteobacteria bacterium]
MCRDALIVVFCLATLLLLPSLSGAEPKIRDEPIRPLPLSSAENPAKVDLGWQLFQDKRLSASGQVSCSSCHRLDYYGMEREAFSIGANEQFEGIKTPTVINSQFNFRQFWDGRVVTLAEQVEATIENQLELNNNWQQLLFRLRQDGVLRQQFEQIYEQGLDKNSVVDAIVTFERTLISSNSAFDRWLRGEESALSKKALQGYALFKSYGCISCHQGQNVGGNMFARMGAMGNYFIDRNDDMKRSDLGLFTLTDHEDDKHVFKVPSLRFAALNRYFFHDASVDSLQEAIQIMGKYQLGRKLPEKDIVLIEAFLKSLLGDLPPAFSKPTVVSQ